MKLFFVESGGGAMNRKLITEFYNLVITLDIFCTK